MNRRLTLRRGTVAAAAAALVLSPLSALGTGFGTAQADTVPTPTHGLDFDYFNEVYPNAGANSVFETVTLERFKYLLRDKTGNFAFFIGDPSDANAQATIGYINQVAKQRGITKIYNFTPKIDGGKWNLWNWNDLESVTGGNALAYWKNEGPLTAGATGVQGNPLSYYTTHTDDYLNDDTTPEFVRTDGVINGPYLFVYNKDRQVDVGGTPTDDHIVSSLSDRKVATDLDTPGEVDAYKAQVDAVLGAVPTHQYAVNSAFDYWKDNANRRHAATYADAPEPGRYGGTEILDDSDKTDGWRVQPITYPEWIALLKHAGDIPFLFGGTWCHNTRAIVKDTNRLAQKYGVKKVYNFDYSLFSTSNGGTNYDHSRSSGTSITTGTGADTRLLYPSQVYGQTVNTYLTNATAEYGKVGQVGTPPNTPHYYYPGGDVSQAIQNAVRIQVGHVLSYNKDHQDAAGSAAPVVDQALRQNDDGGQTEYMTEWWFVKNRDLPASNGAGRGSATVDSSALANQRAFAREGIDDIEQVFRGLATELASTTTVSGVSGPVTPGDAVTLDVSVGATGYSPYLSVNGAGGNLTPGTLEAKPRGWVRLLDGSGAEVTRARLTRAGTASFPLGAQTVTGTKSYTVQYLGRGDLVQPSSRAVSFLVANPTTTVLAGPDATAHGAGGTLTATVTDGATGKVRLAGLPSAIEADIVGHTATFTLPTSLPAGSYQVRADYLGDSANGTSQSAARSLTVSQASASVGASAPGTSYGKAAAVTVTVTGAGAVPTGTVRVLEGSKAVATGTLSGGKATVRLPAAFAVKKHALTVAYAGDGNYAVASHAVTLAVAKGTAKAPTFKPTGKVSAKKAGKTVITVRTAKGLATPDGKVKVTLKRGATVKTVSARLGRKGSVQAKLPQLTAGTWSVKVTYLGNATYRAGKPKAFKLTVKK